MLFTCIFAKIIPTFSWLYEPHLLVETPERAMGTIIPEFLYVHLCSDSLLVALILKVKYRLVAIKLLAYLYISEFLVSVLLLFPGIKSCYQDWCQPDFFFGWGRGTGYLKDSLFILKV